MKISIISVGKFEKNPQKQIFESYFKRIKYKIDLKELELKNSKNLSSKELKEGEAKLILKALNPNSKLIILDENAKQYKSREFAKLISNFAVSGDSNLTFVIGGADGLADEIINKSQVRISLGLMTYPHLMVRSILIEQIYRAQTIIEGHPYHRD